MARTQEQIQAITDQLAKNAEYWEDRFNRLENATHISAENYVKELDKQYKLASKSIKDKLAYFYAQFADSESISLAEAKKLLDDDQLAEFHMSVEEYIKMGESPQAMDPDIQKKLERASIKYRVTRLEAIETELAAEVEQLRLKSQDIAYSAVGNAYRDRYYRTIFEIQKGIGVGSTFSKVDENRLSKILDESWVADGLNFSDRIWKNKASLQNELTNALSQALILGQGYAETSEKFQGRMGVSFTNSARLIVTESAYYASTAQKESFKDLNVEQYEIVATLDHVTSEICRHMDGQIFKMSEFKAGVTAPPFHPNCRTTTCPYFDDSDLEGYTPGTRAARDSEGSDTYQVPADLDYDEWFRIYVLGEPEEVIGSLKNYRKKHQNNILKMVKDAPGLAKRVYNKCVDSIKVVNPNYRGDKAYYMPPQPGVEDGVLLDMVNASKGSSYQTPYQVKFHEDGHNIDHILNILYGDGDPTKGLSETYKDGVFGKTIEKEARETIEKYALDNKVYKYTKEEAKQKAIEEADDLLKYNLIYDYEYDEQVKKMTKRLANELDLEQATKDFCDHIIATIPDLRDRADISDMFEVYTHQLDIFYPFGVGHGKVKGHNFRSYDYFDLHDNGVEGFAEIFSAMVANKGSLKYIRQYFPETYDLMLEMLGKA